jgi:NADPH:quinone reductase-like Zn-dependent oxidoreductase
MLDFSAVPGAVPGYDFAGTVVALGKDALAEGKLQVGDRVAGLVCNAERNMESSG